MRQGTVVARQLRLRGLIPRVDCEGVEPAWRGGAVGNRECVAGEELVLRDVGEELQLWRVEFGSPYAAAMRIELGAAVDRRLAELIIIRLRRSWPLLKLMPSSCIVPIVVPAATRLRRSLCRSAVAGAALAGAVIAIIAVLT